MNAKKLMKNMRLLTYPSKLKNNNLDFKNHYSTTKQAKVCDFLWK